MYDDYINKLYSESSFTKNLSIHFNVPIQDIEDYLQNTMIIILNNKPTVKDYNHFKHIVIRCIKQRVINNYKKASSKTYNLTNKEEVLEQLEAKQYNPIELPEEFSYLLKERELVMAQMLSEGYTHREIADKLHLSKDTVTELIKYIRIKLEVKGYGNSQKQVQKEKGSGLGERARKTP